MKTYVEFADSYEEINAIPLTAYYNNIIILRGASKFFAAPGLRLGYAITQPGSDRLYQHPQKSVDDQFSCRFIGRDHVSGYGIY